LPRAPCVEVKNALGEKYALITALDPFTPRRWKLIAKAARPYDTELIFPFDLKIPEEIELVPYSPILRFLPFYAPTQPPG
jgi:hypothetical protein